MALYVVGYHCVIMSGALESIYFRPLVYGRFAVCVFIVLSGFCLTLPVLKTGFTLANGAGDFFRRRAWRILPPYYAAVTISLLAIVALIHQMTGSFWDYSLPITPKDIALHLILLQNFFGDDYFKINPVLWTIAVEWQIYFLFPLLLWGWRSFGAIPTTLAAVLVSSLGEFGMFHFLSSVPNLNFLGLFALGMLAAYTGFSPDKLAVTCRGMPWGWFAIVALPLSLYLDKIPHGTARLLEDVSVGCLAVSVLVVAVRDRAGWLRRLLDFRPLVFIGSFSYSVYLVHAPFLQIVWQYFVAPLKLAPNVTCVILLTVAAPIVVVIAYLFFLVGERPFLRKKGRKIAHVS